MMEEQWKPVPGYEDFYAVSSYGRVMAFPRIVRKRRGNKIVDEIIGEHLLKPSTTYKGYLVVRLYKDGTSKDIPVHRLVMLAFVPNPQNLPQVNHKDENKKNNRLDNLEWCDGIYNRNYGEGAKHNWKAVGQYTREMRFIRRFESTVQAARETGIVQTCICSCANGKRKTAGGFVWLSL